MHYVMSVLTQRLSSEVSHCREECACIVHRSSTLTCASCLSFTRFPLPTLPLDMSVLRLCCLCMVYGDIVATFPPDTEGVMCAGKSGLACCGCCLLSVVPYIGSLCVAGELCVFVCVRTSMYGCLICSDPRIPTLLCPTRSLKHRSQVKFWNARPTHARPLLRKKLPSSSLCSRCSWLGSNFTIFLLSAAGGRGGKVPKLLRHDSDLCYCHATTFGIIVSVCVGARISEHINPPAVLCTDKAPIWKLVQIGSQRTWGTNSVLIGAPDQNRVL